MGICGHWLAREITAEIDDGSIYFSAEKGLESV